jgi:DNA modification methylase
MPKLKRIKLAEIRLDERNANLGTKRGRDFIEGSLKKYGLGRSILLDRNGSVIAGNKTLEAFKAAGGKELVVVGTRGDALVAVQREDLTIDSRKGRSLAIADNRASEIDLEWSPEVLASFDLNLGDLFDNKDLRAIMGDLSPEIEAPEPHLDKAAELQKKWKTARGQIWKIGEHRLMCGDSCSQNDILLLMGDEKAEMCFTDPPWNVAIGGDGNPRHRQRRGLTNDSMGQFDFAFFLDRAAATISRFTTGDVYCVMGCEQWPTIDAALRSAKLHWSATIIWVKDLFVLGRSKYHRRYEPVWYGWPETGRSSFCGARNLDDVWEIPRPRTSEEHPTMKPVALYQRAVANSSANGGAVFDPFAGSGTVFAVAERMGRVARGCEIDPRFVAVTLERLAEMGLSPEMAGTERNGSGRIRDWLGTTRRE